MNIYWPKSLYRLVPYILILAIVLLGIEVLLADVFHFEFEGFGFFAWLGFLSCAALIVMSLLVGKFIKRAEHYYDD